MRSQKLGIITLKKGSKQFSPMQNLDDVFLIDDVVDSKWTLTVIAALLQQAGSGCVYPVALDWLKRAENEGAVKKLLNPVRYQFMNPD